MSMNSHVAATISLLTFIRIAIAILICLSITVIVLLPAVKELLKLADSLNLLLLFALVCVSRTLSLRGSDQGHL